MDKKASRLRRASKARQKIQRLRMHRLSIYRSNLHTYAAITSQEGGSILASSSTLEKSVRVELSIQSTNSSNKLAAALVGKRIAEKAKTLGINSVAFDRAGFHYHGRVKALAEAAREAGLKF